MKVAPLLALTTAGLLALSSSCRKDEASPLAGLTTGRLAKSENTVDATGQITRPRWIIDLAPLSLAGYQGALYPQAKAFNLPTGTPYHVGQTLTFRYQLVPYAQQTPWKTGYEWNGVPAQPPDATALPEITLSDVSN